MNRNSDIDLLIVTDDTVHCRRESVRLRKEIGSIGVPVDLLVVRESDFEEHADNPGLIYREIVRTGRKVYEAEG